MNTSRHKRVVRKIEDFVNSHQWQYFAAFAVGIGLFFAVGIGKKVFVVIAEQAGGEMSRLDFFIALFGSIVIGGILGIMLYILVLYIWFWRKT